MLATQRQELIAEAVRREGSVRVVELAERFGVSDMTIRRDLELLAEQERLVKVHGGATALEGSAAAEPGFAVKSGVLRAEKERIGRRAAELVPPGSAVALSAGTTTWAAARHLVRVPGLTVVTNSWSVAEVFHAEGGADQTVVLTGGTRTPSDALVGPIAVAAVASLNVDVLLLGVHGMSVRAGLTTPNLLEAETDRALMAAARRRIVLADHTKWGVTGLSTIAPLRDADVLVTDDGLPEEARADLAAHVGELVIV
ncbi:DeoR family transcriptional regulator [Actinocorallia herbida]|uniref:DeoR family transcriptional regulator n=1 Tax=Actinocorallia herbida TaxID=58109 RepID=A0A3N1D0B5_9ACTN|nr:DeoR/GlpR family DNA-binding transcription regulator [Actinocorallia herbida]ROO86969.1 DeoR family transcriptional regulator [Actinocorallia herbida]